MAKNQNLSKQLGIYFEKRAQRESDFRHDCLKLDALLCEEFGSIPGWGTEDVMFWEWLAEWASYFSEKEAFEWINAGKFNAKEAYQMKQKGQSPEDRV